MAQVGKRKFATDQLDLRNKTGQKLRLTRQSTAYNARLVRKGGVAKPGLNQRFNEIQKARVLNPENRLRFILINAELVVDGRDKRAYNARLVCLNDRYCERSKKGIEQALTRAEHQAFPW